MLTLQAPSFNLNKHNQLCVRDPQDQDPNDFLVVFYKGSRCNLCYNLLPGFAQAKNLVQGCTFATVDLSDPHNMKVRRLALESTTPLNTIPQIIMYFRDIPISEYHLRHLNNFTADLKNWIITVAGEVQSQVNNNDLVFSEEDNTTCIGDRCELSIPTSKPTIKRYKKL